MARLAIQALSLSHFRSHKTVRLELDDRPVALFGPNGAGKTNLLEAVSLLSPGRGLRRGAASEMGRRPEALGWKVRAEVAAFGQVHEIATWSDGGAARLVTIDDKAAPQIALARIARIVWLIPAMDRLWIESADGRRRFLDRMVLSFIPSHAEASLTYEKAMRERNRLLKEHEADPAWYAALEERMALAGAAIQTNRLQALARIATAQTSAATGFPAADLTLTGPDGADQTLGAEELATALRQGRSADMAAGRTLSGPHRSDLGAIYAAKGIAARHCSTGEQKALLLSLILSNARALTEDFGAPPLLLLDEVAAHLDSGRRAALYEEIVALRAQAWMTGTGAELFDDLGNRAQRLEVTETDGVSEIKMNALGDQT